MCFLSYLSRLLGRESLRSRLCSVLFLYTQHIVRELAPGRIQSIIVEKIYSFFYLPRDYLAPSDCHSATTLQSVLPSSTGDRGVDSILSTCLTYEMRSILIQLLRGVRGNITREGDEGEQDTKGSLEGSWGRCLVLSRKAGPLGARLKEQCPLGIP